jgi:GAF domain-containing protein
MSLFDDPGNPRWKLLTVAEERLEIAPSRDAVIEVVRSTARSVLDADGVTFILRDGNLCHYVEEDAIGPLWKGQRFPMSACISGWSMLHAETAVIEDIYQDDRIPIDAYRPTFVKSLIMTPVGDAPPVAAIGAYWRDRRRFTDREIMAIKTLSVAVGRALSDYL